MQPSSGRLTSIFEEVKGVRMQTCSCRGYDRAALLGPSAVNPRHHSTRFFDDRDQRDDIVGLERRFDSEVDAARSKHCHGIAFATVARHPDRSGQTIEALLEFTMIMLRRGRMQDGLRQCADVPSGQSLALACTLAPSPICGGPETLTREGLAHHSHFGSAIDGETNQRAPDRKAADEWTSPIHRVQHPAIRAASSLTKFLTQ